MKKPILVLALAALAMPLVGTLSPAEAGVRWHAGADFRVGGFDFSIGFSTPRHYGPSFRPSFFYRTRAPLRYGGYQCSSACYIRDSYRYHHQRCPVVNRHFGLARFDPYEAWRYAELGWYDGGYGGYYGHRSYRGYNDYRRYDRYRDHRRYRNDRHRRDRYRHDRNRHDRRRYAPDRRDWDRRDDRDHGERDRGRAYPRHRNDGDSDSDSGRRGRGRRN